VKVLLRDSGIVVWDLESGGPADKAGLPGAPPLLRRDIDSAIRSRAWTRRPSRRNGKPKRSRKCQPARNAPRQMGWVSAEWSGCRRAADRLAAANRTPLTIQSDSEVCHERRPFRHDWRAPHVDDTSARRRRGSAAGSRDTAGEMRASLRAHEYFGGGGSGGAGSRKRERDTAPARITGAGLLPPGALAAAREISGGQLAVGAQ